MSSMEVASRFDHGCRHFNNAGDDETLLASHGSAPTLALSLCEMQASFCNELGDQRSGTWKRLEFGVIEESTDESGNEQCMDHSDAEKSTDDEHPLSWLTPTPTPSPPQSPRAQMFPMLDACTDAFIPFSSTRVSGMPCAAAVAALPPMAGTMPADFQTQVPPHGVFVCPPACSTVPASSSPQTALLSQTAATPADDNRLVFPAPADLLPTVVPTMMSKPAASLGSVSLYFSGRFGSSVAIPEPTTVPAADQGVMAVLSDPTVSPGNANAETADPMFKSAAVVGMSRGKTVPLLPPGVFNVSMPTQLSFGNSHHFHDETSTMGSLSGDRRRFSKTEFHGRLSLVTEDQIHCSGVKRYLVQFCSGELSSADGVGFVFASSLPCSKNIQRISSIFVNRAGRICMRARSTVQRSDVGVKRLEVGEWVEMIVNLDELIAQFTVWTRDGVKASTACFAFGNIFRSLKDTCQSRRGGRRPADGLKASGHFACLVKHAGVQVALGS